MECEINSIACPICIDLSHKNHTMISLKKFISTEIPKLYAKKPDYKLLSKVIMPFKLGNQWFERNLSWSILCFILSSFKWWGRQSGTNWTNYKKNIRTKSKRFINKITWFVGWETSYIRIKILAYWRKRLKTTRRFYKVKLLIVKSMICVVKWRV